MRRAVLAVSAIVLLSITAGCSGSGSETKVDKSAKPAPLVTLTQAPKAAEPYEGMSNAEMIKPILASVQQASSVHVISWTYDGKKKVPDVNLKLTKSGKGYGTMMIGGSPMSFRRLGPMLYMKFDGSWVKVRKGSSKDSDQLFEMFEISHWAKYFKYDSEDLELLQRHQGTMVGGVKTTALLDGPQGEMTTGGFFFPTGGPPFPLEFRIGTPYP